MYDPEYPYDVILNGKPWNAFRDLEGETIIGLGSGVRSWNTIQVYFQDRLVLDIDTDDGTIVNERVREAMTRGWE